MKILRSALPVFIAAFALAAPAGATYAGRAGLLSFSSDSRPADDDALSIFVQSPVHGAARELFGDRAKVYGTRPSDSNPSWSSDGRRFVLARNNGVISRIYVANADQTGVREVPLPPDVFAEDPAFGPDGKTIAYVEVAPGDPSYDLSRGPESVHVARLDGSHSRTLGGGAQPAWTPDGRVVYSTGSRGCSALVIARPYGGGRRVITAGRKVHGECRGGGGYPDVSPDGKLVAFTGHHLLTMRLDGTRRQIVPGTRGAYTCAWSPTGHSIAYFAGRGGGIRITTPEGGEIRRLAGNGGFPVTWQPVP